MDDSATKNKWALDVRLFLLGPGVERDVAGIVGRRLLAIADWVADDVEPYVKGDYGATVVLRITGQYGELLRAYDELLKVGGSSWDEIEPDGSPERSAFWNAIAGNAPFGEVIGAMSVSLHRGRWLQVVDQ